MGLFSFKRNTSDSDLFSTMVFSGTRSFAVTEEQAMLIPAFKSCVELISSTVAQLPIYLYEEQDNGDVLAKKNDNKILLLNESPNKYDTGSVLKKRMVSDLLLYGKAYLYKKDGNLHYLPANKITVEDFTEDDITLSLKRFIYVSPTATVTLNEDEVIVIDSGTNGVLVDGSDILTTAQNELAYTKNVLQNGALPVGVLKSAARLTDGALNRLKESFANLYGGASNAGKTLVLEEGLSYQPISLDPNQLQLNETNKQTLSSIARLFNVPESMINSSANKYGSLEMNNMHFLQYTISPLITVIESALNKGLLDKLERNSGQYFRFDTSEVLRVTEKEKVDTTLALVNGGLISMNEGRAKLDLEKVEKDFFKLGLGNVLQDRTTGELSILNLGQNFGESEEQPNGSK